MTKRIESSPYVEERIVGKLDVMSPGVVAWYCPGCDMLHPINVGEGSFPKWGWNNQHVHVTFTPSVLVKYPWGPEQVEVVCHSFITDGMIQYLDDCTHSYKGKTIELPYIPDEWK